MIALQIYHKQISPLDLEKLAGIKFIMHVCAGSQSCRRDGEHSTHFWYEEIMLTDPIRVTHPKKDCPDRVDVTIRWFNFCWAVLQVMETEKLKGLDLVRRSLAYAKHHCFDLDGSPSNLARLNQHSSYSKFMVNIEERLKVLE